MMERTASTLTLALALLGLACFPGCGAQPKQVENPDPLGLGADDVEVADDSSDDATATISGDDSGGRP